MEFQHRSVLLTECINGLKINPNGVYVDATLGGGGHSAEICRRLSSKGILIGTDRDGDAIAAASKRLAEYNCGKILVQRNYSEIAEVIAESGISGVNGIIADLGVSSFQLDSAERGFSYMQDAPLDMRMNRDEAFSAFEVVNGYSQADLERIIKHYGEERWAKRIAEFIVSARNKHEIKTTGELVSIIKAAVPKGARKDGPHPAKRTFQAIRIEVNGELEHLGGAVDSMCDILNPGGRLCVITFHSLEDRIVKDKIRERENGCICPPGMPICTCGRRSDMLRITKKPIVPSEAELLENPRSRSAKLRIAERK